MRPTHPRHVHLHDLTRHSPTRRKTRRLACIKRRGAVSTCVTTPIILSGPTNPWALHLPTPLPRGATQASTWTRVAPAMCPRHLCAPTRRVGSRGSATWPCVPRRIRAGPARHVSSLHHVSSAGSAENKPFFAILIKD